MRRGRHSLRLLLTALVASACASVGLGTGVAASATPFDNASCEGKTPSSFDDEYMNWADQHGISYLAWG
jgi:hypothetical protein